MNPPGPVMVMQRTESDPLQEPGAKKGSHRLCPAGISFSREISYDGTAGPG